MASVIGTRDYNTIPSTQIIRDVYPQMFDINSGWNNNSKVPLLSLMERVKGNIVVQNTKYECFEEADRVRRGTISGTYNTTATDIVIDSVMYGQTIPGQVLYIPNTDERVFVTSRLGRNTIRVIRNWGAPSGSEGTGTAITVTGWNIQMAGVAYEDGSGAPDAVSTNPEASYNYTQIFRHTSKLDKTTMSTALYAERDTRAVRMQKMLNWHKVDINDAFWFGVRRDGDSTGKVIRTTGGIFQHIKTNKTDVSDGIITPKVIDAFLNKISENGSDVKYVFHGASFALGLDNMKRDVIRYVDDTKETYGAVVREYKSSLGTIRFVLDRKVFGGDNDKKAVCLDLDSGAVKRAVLKGRDTTVEKDIEMPGEDAKLDSVLTQCGLFMVGYGLDNSLAADTGEKRGIHGMLYTSASGGWTY